jgi:hypothetical protein
LTGGEGPWSCVGLTPQTVPALVAEVRRLRWENCELAARLDVSRQAVEELHAEMAADSRVPMPWNTPPLDVEGTRKFVDEVWNKPRPKD